MKKTSMGWLCPLLMLLPAFCAQAQTWQNAHDLSSHNITEFKSVTAKGNTFLAYGMDNEENTATIVMSIDGGQTFSVRKKYAANNVEGMPVDSVFFAAAPAINDEGDFFAAADKGIYKSTDQGENYTNVYRKNNRRIIDVDFMGNTGLAIAQNTTMTLALVRSTDGGQTWNDVTTNISIVADEIVFVNPQTIFVYSKNFRKIYKSTDAGQNWTKLADLLAPAPTSSKYKVVFTDADNAFFSTHDATTNKSFIYKTANGGIGWTKIYESAAGQVSFFARNQNQLVLHHENGTRLIMDANGNSVATTNVDKFLNHFANTSTKQYAIAKDNNGDFYVYTTAFSTLNIIEEKMQAVSELRIFPNPCNGENLNINYTLKSADNISIRISDISGKIIYTKHIGNQPAGRYTTKLENADLAKGIYMMNLISSQENINQKLIIQ